MGVSGPAARDVDDRLDERLRSFLWQVVSSPGDQAMRVGAGELRAINTLFTWITGLWNLGQSAMPAPVAKESDSLVMASIIHRIRQSEPLPSAADTSILTLGSSIPEESE